MNSIIGSIRGAFEYLSLHLLRRIEIRYRLINSFILLSLLPLLISGYISYVESSKAIESRTRVFSTEVVKQVSKNVQLRMAQIDAESEGLVLSDQVQHGLDEVASGNEITQSAARQSLTRILLEHYGSFDFINQKYLIDKDNKIIDTQVFAQLTQGVVRFVEQAPNLHGRPYWGSYDNGVGQQNLGMLRAIISKSSNKLIGNLFLVIRPEHFSAIFDDINLGGGTDIFILDASNGKVIVRTYGKQSGTTDDPADPALVDEIAKNMSSGGQSGFVAFQGKEHSKYLAAHTRIPGTTWFVVSTIPEDKLMTESQSVRNKIVLIGVLGFLFSIIVAYIISNSISAPLKKLVGKMRETGGLDLQGNAEDSANNLVEIKGQDELGRLSQCFDKMNDAVKQKIQQINEINASLERKVTERTAALAASEQESRTLIENSPDTIARYDRECRRIFANQAFGAIAPGGVAALVGKKPSEIPGGAISTIYETKIKEVFATGKNTQFELKWSGKDGNEICSHIRLTAERDLSGKVTTVLGVGRDITELNNSQTELRLVADALRRNDELLKESQIIAGLGTYALDIPSGQWESSDILDELFGIDKEYERSIEGWAALLHPDDRTKLLDYLTNEVVGQGRVFDKEYRIIRHHDLAERWVHGLGKLELDAQRRPLKMHGTVQDITERKKAEQLRTESIRKLEVKELAKTRFLAAAGHDMRQPLAAANLFIDALKFTSPTSEQNQIIQRLEQAMSNFNNLLDTLLNVSKLDAGMIKPEYASINVGELLNWLEQNLAPLASEKKIRLRLHFSIHETLVVRSDIGLVQSVLMNLVSNAIKFTLNGGILISARRRGSSVLFQVWDTGLGIKSDQVEKIFDEFYQINNPQRDRTRGLGLGLSIVKRALSLLGEEITCRSQLEHGSVFGFRLPLDAEANDVPQQQDVTVTPLEDVNQASFVQGKRFVVVEDDALVAEALNNALVRMGAVVKLFHNAEVALNHADIGEADYYVVDFMLGGSINGMQFLNLLRQKLGKTIKAVMMTGDTSPTFVREAVNCPWPVLHKPASMAKLISSIRAQEP